MCGDTGPAPAQGGAGATHNMTLSTQDLNQIAESLHAFKFKKDDKSRGSVSSWLNNSHRILKKFGVADDKLVDIVTMKLDPDTEEEYAKWAADGDAYRHTWDGFSEFMIRFFVGAVSELDAFVRTLQMKIPLTEHEMDKAIREFCSLCDIVGFKAMDVKVFLLACKIPTQVVIQLVEHKEGLRSMTVEAVMAILRMYVSARGVAQRREPMDVDAIEEHLNT
ncbi:hypothetical protein IWW57_006766 [Coemansia sp. S610]|nr:hypothetical protein IWW57_006766 [Coemansia sp. S610]